MAIKPPPGDEALKLGNQLCFPLYAASRLIIQRYKPILDPLGLTYTQYITLMALWERDGETVTALGERLLLDSGTLTPLLKKLEAQGLLRRERGTEDERLVSIFLTRAGKALKKRARMVPRAVASCLEFDADHARQLHSLLHSLIRELSG